MRRFGKPSATPSGTARSKRTSWRAWALRAAQRAWTWWQLTVPQLWVTPLALWGIGAAGPAVAPLCVAPSRHGEGIGSSLMNDLIRRAEAAGWPLVLVLGDPRYYQRFGFRRASTPPTRRVHLLLGGIPTPLRGPAASARVRAGGTVSNRPRSPPLIAPTARRSTPPAPCAHLPGPGPTRNGSMWPSPGVPRADVGPVVGIRGACCCHWCCGLYWGQGRC